MAKLAWDEAGKKLYETGTRYGVLYPEVDTDEPGAFKGGVAWNGLTGVDESPSGADPNNLWADDQKYLVMRGAEEFGFTIKAYTYPDEFEACDGSASPVSGVSFGQQKRMPFGFCYRSVLGNDAKLENYGYKLHLIYGATANPSERSYATINDNPDAIEFSWDCETTPVATTVKINGETLKAVSCITIDSTKFATEALRTKLDALEAALYGDDDNDPRLPSPDEVYNMLKAA